MLECLYGFQVNTSSGEFKIALERLNEAVTEKNVAALKKIQEMSDPSIPEKDRLSEDQILVGIGVHLVKKLTGKGETTWKRSQIYCPCGCKEKLDYSDSMFIGKYILVIPWSPVRFKDVSDFYVSKIMHL